jgi:hypothetical protein
MLAQPTTPSVFYTALILSCLPQLKDHCLDFLMEQKSSRWSWNYQPRTSLMRYPDDLDDTFIVLSSLYYNAPELITEEAMVAIVNLLIKNEVTPGGPYYTWDIPHVDNPDWNDVDIVANSNIMYFCTQLDISLPPLFSWIEKRIEEGNLDSLYYQSPLTVIYFLSKWYQGKHRTLLIETLFEKPWKNPMEIALGVSAYLRLGGEPCQVEDFIIKLVKEVSCDETGAYPFFVERVIEGKPLWSGSSAFTNACIAEALSLYRNKTTFEKSSTEPYQDIISQIIVRTLARAPVSNQVKSLQKDFSLPNIALIPYLFFVNLHAHRSSSITLDQVLDLCSANVLGWIGFTFYDDILDGDIHYSHIPLANICTREASHIFHRLTSDETVLTILNGIDEANQWEYDSCKQCMIRTILSLPETLPDYGDYSILAEKSLGHAIGPMIIAGAKVKNFFVPYLIARQLNDDAHDWVEDLRKGFLNPVSIAILTLWKERNPSRKEINLATEKDSLQKIFWEDVIDSVTENILFHVSSARNILPTLDMLSSTEFLETLLTPLEQSAKRALMERDSAKRFMELYE